MKFKKKKKPTQNQRNGKLFGVNLVPVLFIIRGRR